MTDVLSSLGPPQAPSVSPPHLIPLWRQQRDGEPGTWDTFSSLKLPLDSKETGFGPLYNITWHRDFRQFTYSL